MTKIVLDDVASGYNLSKINNNFEELASELQDKILYRSNPTGEPNQMENPLDMNSRDILNTGVIYASTLVLGGEVVAPGDVIAVDPAYPVQSGNDGKYLKTNGLNVLWGDPMGDLANTTDPALGVALVGNAVSILNEQRATHVSAVAGGTADAITASFSTAIASYPSAPATLHLLVRSADPNVSAVPTFSPNGLTPKTIVKAGNSALVAGDIAGNGHWLELEYDATLGKWVLLNPAYSARGVSINSDTAKFGYEAGAGGTVTQLTSKSTAVTLNKPTGLITLHNAALAAGAVVNFVLNNTYISGANDLVIVKNTTGFASAGSYQIWAEGGGGGNTQISVKNNTAGSLSEAITLSFAIVKGSSN